MAREISTKTSRKLANLSLLAAIFVAVIHLRWPVETDAGRLFSWIIHGTVVKTGVPLFFLMSGFFLARHFDEPGWYGRAVRKRLSSICLPYVIWIAIHTVVLWVITGTCPTGWRNAGFDLCSYPVVAPLWYLRCLMVFVLMSPILLACVRRCPVVAFGILLVVFLVWPNLLVCLGMDGEHGIGGFFSYGISLEGLFFFTMGSALSLHREWFLRIGCGKAMPAVLCLLGIAVMMAIQAYAVVEGVVLTFFPCGLVIPLMIYLLWRTVPDWRLPKCLNNVALPIIVMHCTIYDVCRIMSCFGRWESIVQFLLGTMGAVAIFNLLRTYLPKVAALLFGGRVS